MWSWLPPLLTRGHRRQPYEAREIEDGASSGETALAAAPRYCGGDGADLWHHVPGGRLLKRLDARERHQRRRAVPVCRQGDRTVAWRVRTDVIPHTEIGTG